MLLETAPAIRAESPASGGGRVAATLGFILKDSIAGVIGCGAGFDENYLPKKELPFPFYDDR